MELTKPKCQECDYCKALARKGKYSLKLESTRILPLDSGRFVERRLCSACSETIAGKRYLWQDTNNQPIQVLSSGAAAIVRENWKEKERRKLFDFSLTPVEPEQLSFMIEREERSCRYERRVETVDNGDALGEYESVRYEEIWETKRTPMVFTLNPCAYGYCSPGSHHKHNHETPAAHFWTGMTKLAKAEGLLAKAARS